LSDFRLVNEANCAKQRVCAASGPGRCGAGRSSQGLFSINMADANQLNFK
jgi:hypothetical protein